MIDSVIFRYLDEQGEEMLSVGSQAFMKNKLQDSRQLIESVGLQQTQEQWEYLIEMNQQELYNALTGFMHENRLKVIMPN